MEDRPKFSMPVDEDMLETHKIALAQTEIEYFVAEHPGGLRLFTWSQEDLEKVKVALNQLGSNKTFEQLMNEPLLNKKIERANRQNLSKLEALRKKSKED